jgi:hypothetical protein
MVRVGLVAFLLLSLGCGGGSAATHPAPAPVDDDVAPEPAAPPPPPPTARIRAIHAAFDPSAASLDLTFAGADEPVSGLHYEFASPYVAIADGSHAVSIASGGTELIQATVDVAAPTTYTTVLFSTTDFPVASRIVADAPDAPEAGARMRFFHDLLGQGAIDVCSPGATPREDGTPIFTGVQPASFAETAAHETYVSIAADQDLPIQLRATHSTPCHGRVIGASHFFPVSGNNYTLVVVGRTRGRPAVARELLFCADPPAEDTSCATNPIDAGR